MDFTGGFSILGPPSGSGFNFAATYEAIQAFPSYPGNGFQLGAFVAQATLNDDLFLTMLPGQGGAMVIQCEQQWTSTAQGTQITFLTTLNGGTAGFVAAHMHNQGNFEILGSVATKPGGGSWVAPSDIRLKQDVRDYTNGLDTILALNPIKYRYNGRGGIKDTESVHVGLDADATLAVFPEIVGTTMVKMEPTPREETVQDDPPEPEPQDEEAPSGRIPRIKRPTRKPRRAIQIDVPDTEVLTIDPSALTYVLINAVKELTARLEALEAK
jgi:hypothetical protein